MLCMSSFSEFKTNAYVTIVTFLFLNISYFVNNFGVLYSHAIRIAYLAIFNSCNMCSCLVVCL